MSPAAAAELSREIHAIDLAVRAALLSGKIEEEMKELKPRIVRVVSHDVVCYNSRELLG